MKTAEEMVLIIKRAQRMANTYKEPYVVLRNGLIVDEKSIKDVVDPTNVIETCKPIIDDQ